MLFQGAALFDSMTVAENIAFPLAERRHALHRTEIKTRVDEMLERLKITDIAHAFPSAISAGQRKRVGLARAIITRPKLMIYDEPTTGQDPIMIRYVDDMILEAHDAFQLTTIVISHDMVSTFRIADQIAMVYDGVIATCGTPDELMVSQHPEVQRMIRAQIH
jgi:ABC-type transporter Mla maintaining outer membrane lipid asymmetry ATPase subunit MlaF